jgi:hypothetical protein
MLKIIIIGTRNKKQKALINCVKQALEALMIDASILGYPQSSVESRHCTTSGRVEGANCGFFTPLNIFYPLSIFTKTFKESLLFLWKNNEKFQ